MAPRAVRRNRVRELRKAALKKTRLNRHSRRAAYPFRPVYGHAIPAPDHLGNIHMLYVKDPVAAWEWMEKVVVGRALVAWGQALQSSRTVS